MGQVEITAQETLNLVIVALNKRRNYLLKKINEIPTSSKFDEMKRISRQAMLSEVTTIKGLISEIQRGQIHPAEIWD